MSFLVIEGLDGTGKTTLAERLSEEYCANVVHFGPPKDADKACAEYCDAILRLQKPLDAIIFDRFHWGSQAYGQVFRRRRDLSLLEMSVVDRMLLEAGAAVVYCRPPRKFIADVLQEREHSGATDPRGYENVALQSDLDKVFQECYDVTPLPKTWYSWPYMDSLHEVHQMIEEALGWTRC